VSARTVVASLTPEEWEIVCRLREVSESALRRELLDVVRETLAFAAVPACAEMQGDGAPCPTPHTSCDECRHVVDGLSRLRHHLVVPATPGR
jgi:hypothetical protein